MRRLEAAAAKVPVQPRRVVRVASHRATGRASRRHPRRSSSRPGCAWRWRRTDRPRRRPRRRQSVKRMGVSPTVAGSGAARSTGRALPAAGAGPLPARPDRRPSRSPTCPARRCRSPSSAAPSRPQKVIGPPAAAANSSVAAGASPAPSSSSSATRGISNSNGTLISTPIVAATAMPARLSPRKASTVCGCRIWMAAPLANPATTMIGPMRTTIRPVARAQRRSPWVNSTVQPQSGSAAAAGVRSQASGSGESPATRATRGPSRNAADSPSSTRLAPQQRRKHDGDHHQRRHVEGGRTMYERQRPLDSQPAPAHGAGYRHDAGRAQVHHRTEAEALEDAAQGTGGRPARTDRPVSGTPRRCRRPGRRTPCRSRRVAGR